MNPGCGPRLDRRSQCHAELRCGRQGRRVELVSTLMVARIGPPPQVSGEIVLAVSRPRARTHLTVEIHGSTQVLDRVVEPPESRREQPKISIDDADAAVSVSDRMSPGIGQQTVVQR